MNALDALYRCQRAWEATQPQLFMELWPDTGLDDTHADSRSCGSGEPVCVVEPGAAASPEAAGLEPRLSERGGPGLAHGNARTGTHEPTPCSLSRAPRLTAGEVESAGWTENVSGKTAGGDSGGTRPTGVAPSPAVSRVLNPGDTEPRRAHVHEELTVPRAAPSSPLGGGSVSPLYTTAPGRKTSQSSAAGGRR